MSFSGGIDRPPWWCTVADLLLEFPNDVVLAAWISMSVGPRISKRRGIGPRDLARPGSGVFRSTSVQASRGGGGRVSKFTARPLLSR